MYEENLVLSKIDDVSYNTLNGGKKEYEILLQKGSEYRILEAQKFNKTTILVVRWIPSGQN